MLPVLGRRAWPARVSTTQGSRTGYNQLDSDGELFPSEVKATTKNDGGAGVLARASIVFAQPSSLSRGGYARLSGVLLQPLHFLADFDFPVPGILGQAVAFSWKD